MRYGEWSKLKILTKVIIDKIIHMFEYRSAESIGHSPRSMLLTSWSKNAKKTGVVDDGDDEVDDGDVNGDDVDDVDDKVANYDADPGGARRR